MRQRSFVVCAAAFVAIALVLFLGVGATSTQAVMYSEDGEHWMPKLTRPLLDRDIRWVPGDVWASTFHVFNDTERDGLLALTIGSEDPALLRAVGVSVAGGDTIESCALVAVSSGEKKLIDAAVSFAGAAGNDTRTSTAHIDLILEWDNGNTARCQESSGVRTNMEGVQR